jgi:hypothetical protein
MLHTASDLGGPLGKSSWQIKELTILLKWFMKNKKAGTELN